MPSPGVQWTQIVRYISDEPSPRIKFGEPILPSENDDPRALCRESRLRVRVCVGDDVFSAVPTDQIETVKALLGPLEPDDVPIIRCIGLNYKTHILETGRALPTHPTVFTKPGPAVAGPDEDIPIPRIAQAQCDYEGELVIVIGAPGKDIPESSALTHVAGYTIGNDVSARDWQRDAAKAGPVPQWSFSKSFDRYAPLGPCLVASRVLGDAGGLALRTRVNGEVRQEGSTADLCFGVRRLVAFCSQGQTLQRGSLIMTGTPGGVGLFMSPPRFLRDGDVVSVEIEGIGSISNRMVFE